MSSPEVVVLVDGVPRPGVVVSTDGDRSLVRFRDAGSHREEWVATASLVPVEATTDRPPVLKLVGLGVVGLLGLGLLLYPGGSDRRLADSTPTPSATPSGTPTPTATPTPTSAPVSDVVDAVLFGDSFTAGRGSPAGTTTALQQAAASLRWRSTVRAAVGTGYTTGGEQGGLPFLQRLAREVRTAPDVLVVQGGAADTGATVPQLTAAANAVVDDLQRRFPRTRLVLVGPVAMEQPVDGQLVRVARTLAAVAKAQGVPFVDPIAQGWVGEANHDSLTSPTGFYPNAAGHAYLGRRLAAVLGPLAR